MVPSGHEEETHGPAGHVGLLRMREEDAAGERRRNVRGERGGRKGSGGEGEARTEEGGDDRDPRRKREEEVGDGLAGRKGETGGRKMVGVDGRRGKGKR